MNKFDLVPLLDYIDPAELDYQEWLNIGFALHHEGYDVNTWDDWSRRDTKRYHEGECLSKWQTFSDKICRITGATITNMAKERGWTKNTDTADSFTVIDWNKSITADPLAVVDTAWLETTKIYEPSDSVWNPVQEIKTYLRTLFNPDEYVGYVTEVYESADGRLSPKQGSYSRTSGQLLDELERYNGKIDDVFGSIHESAGAWIRFNPLDGKGVKNENVTSYRYALIESDVDDVGKQKAIIEELQIPVACMVFSGNKSIHAIVKINAESYETYRKRVDFLYSVLQKNGFIVDKQNRNPSRLSRMPGIMRDGKKQFLIGTHIGKNDFAEWEEWISSVNDDLPNMESLDDIWGNLPPLADPLIHDVLRQGHKMLVAGPSKAGKSFALIQLCIAIAEGRDWLGFQCAKGKVLYVNLELDKASCYHRFYNVYKEKEIPPEHIKNIDIWHLRGKSVPMDQLAPKLIRRAKKAGYIAIIIDPIYKVITGDENSADQMANFCNQFDKICTELECAVIYCHHHSKGSQSGKRSMDRASGSGVFARDPDALLDFIELDTESTDTSTEHVSAWRVEGTLREFSRFKPVNLWFKYPIHEVDDTGYLEIAALEEPSAKGNRKSAQSRQKKKESNKSKLVEAYQTLIGLNPSGDVTVDEVANYLQLSQKTVRNYINEDKVFYVNLGKLIPKKNIKFS